MNRKGRVTEYLQERWDGRIIEATLSSLETTSDNPSDFVIVPSGAVGVVDQKTLTVNESAFYIMSENWTIY